MTAHRNNILILLAVLATVAAIVRYTTTEPTPSQTPVTSEAAERWSVDKIWLGMPGEEIARRHNVSVSGERRIEMEMESKIVSVQFSEQETVAQVVGFSANGLAAGASFDEMLKAFGPPTALEYFSTPTPVVAALYPGELRAVYYPDETEELGPIGVFWLGPLSQDMVGYLTETVPWP
jgi:hypothetical protein